MEIQKAKITELFVNEIYFKSTFNDEIIAGYYERLFKQEIKEGQILPNITLYNKSIAVNACAKIWSFDKYEKARIKDLKSIHLCHDKFCLNCQKLKQATMIYGYYPQIKELGKMQDLYHMTLTVPNVSARELKKTVGQLLNNYSKLMRYFKLNSFIRDVDFEKYGYVGSIRTLEVTYDINKRKKGQEYHPHLHCILALKPGIDLYKNNVNKFSFNYGEFDRKYSDLEILIQKIWYLLNTGKRVTLQEIEGTLKSYSCNIDKMDEKGFFETFKYVTKIFNEKDNSSDRSQVMTFEQFATLYYALYKRRTIQGYGCMYNIQSEEIDESMDSAYDEYIKKLQASEQPETVSEFVLDVMQTFKEEQPAYTYISRKNIHKHLDLEKGE